MPSRAYLDWHNQSARGFNFNSLDPVANRKLRLDNLNTPFSLNMWWGTRKTFQMKPWVDEKNEYRGIACDDIKTVELGNKVKFSNTVQSWWNVTMEDVIVYNVLQKVL